MKESNVKIFLAAQEIKFAKTLAGNDNKLRIKTLKSLKKWLNYRCQSTTPFTDPDFMRLWKGLFYCMWMSDKLLVQEECAELIASLVVSFPEAKVALQFFKCFLLTMSNEWFGIDHLRLDKFLMLVRRVLRQSLRAVKKTKWHVVAIKQFATGLEETILNKTSNVPLGFFLHFTEIYLEELAKISNESLDPTMTTEFIRPYARYLATINDERQIPHIIKHIFQHLMHQSDAGIDFQERFKVWQAQGFRGGTIETIQKVMVDMPIDDSMETIDQNLSSSTSNWEVDDAANSNVLQNEPLDPRAGCKNIMLPSIPFDSAQMISLLEEFRFDKQSTAKSRKAVNRLIHEFKQMQRGVFPLGIKKVKLPMLRDLYDIDEAAERLLDFEEKVNSEKKLTKSQKRKLKKAKNSITIVTAEDSNIDSEIYEEDNLENEGPELKKRKVTPTTLEEFISRSEDGLIANDLDTSDTILTSKKQQKSSKNLNKQRKKQKNRVISTIGCVTVEDCEAEEPGWKIGKPLEKLSAKRSISDDKELIIKTKNKYDKNAKKPRKHLLTAKKKEPIVNGAVKFNCNVLKKGGTFKITHELPSSIQPNTKYVAKSLKLAPTDKTVNIINGISDKITSLVKITTPKRKKSLLTPNISSAEKRVKFALNKNMIQEKNDYHQQLKSSPAIPFDAEKLPIKPLLKRPLRPSPINPFYSLNDCVHLDDSFL